MTILSCEDVNNTTIEVKRILDDLRVIIKAELQLTSLRKVTLLIFILYDWLAHLTRSSPLLVEYSSSLGQEIDSQTHDPQSLIQQWLNGIRLQPISLNQLAYRHYVMQRLLESEITLHEDQPLVHQLMGSMQYSDPQFATLDPDPCWDKVIRNTSRINGLRQQQPALRRVLRNLANRPDETSHRLQVDHAMLSSFTLLYTFHVVEALLDYELAIHADPSIDAIRSAIIHTLNHLRGVFFHV